jgi:transcriptional regulator with XRE-family HTH domain
MNEKRMREIGERLRRLRFAEGFSSPDAWGKRFKTKRVTWLSYEAGRRLIPPTEADRLCDLTGVTMDWLYRGHEHTLPGHVREKLAAAPADLPPPRRSTRTTKGQATPEKP